MIAVTDANVRRLGQIAAHLDTCLSQRGLPRLSDAQCDALWADDLDVTQTMLRDLEMHDGLAVSDTQPVRDVLADLLPSSVRRHLFQAEAS